MFSGDQGFSGAGFVVSSQSVPQVVPFTQMA